MTDVTGLDPTMPAPPLVVDRNPHADIIGHGRTLPLVGGVRHYLYEVLLPDGKQRVYADRAEDVLAAVVPGYATVWSRLQGLMEQLRRSDGDTVDLRDQIADCYSDLFLARSAHARTIRCQLQGQLNSAAADAGLWSQLSEEEQQQVSEAENGAIPLGLQRLFPFFDEDGNEGDYEQGIWETPHVRLVIDRADYGLLSPVGAPEPISELLQFDQWHPDGFVMVVADPPNMLILDSSEDETYLETLESAGVLEIALYPPDGEDQFYLEAVRTGQMLLDTEGVDLTDWIGYDAAAAVDFTGDALDGDVDGYDDDFDENHHHHHGDEHGHSHGPEPDADGWHDHGDGLGPHRH